jgi:hypothetical protein
VRSMLGFEMLLPVSQPKLQVKGTTKSERVRLRRITENIEKDYSLSAKKALSSFTIKARLQDVLRWYRDDKLGSTTIAAKLGVSDWLVKKHLKAQGIVLRGPGKVAATECKVCAAKGKVVPSFKEGRCKFHSKLYHAELNRKWDRKKHQIPPSKWKIGY